MPGFARIRVLGNIGEAEQRVSKVTQLPYIRITVAVNVPGEEAATWYSCCLTGKMGQEPDMLKWLRPGRLVHCEGTPRTVAYKKSDGSLAVSNRILVDKIDFVDSKPKDIPV